MTRKAAFLFGTAILAARLLIAGDFCRGGLQADGVIDWSAATITTTATTTGIQNMTIAAPVRGIAGLVATVTTTSGPETGVIDPNTLALPFGTMTFNRPIKGFSVR